MFDRLGVDDDGELRGGSWLVHPTILRKRADAFASPGARTRYRMPVSPGPPAGPVRTMGARDYWVACGITYTPIWAIEGRCEVAAAFDALIVDQFGVLHDGARAYSQAITRIERLRASGKQLVVLSNSGRRALANRERLASLGFDPAAFHAVVRSGEVAWRALAERADGFHRALGEFNPTSQHFLIGGVDGHKKVESGSNRACKDAVSR